MSDAGRYGKFDSMTPVPTNDLSSLIAAVSRTEANVETIKKTLLPPLVIEAHEARNTSHDAIELVRSHISDVAVHNHPCQEEDRQNEQDDAIVAIRTDAAANAVKIVNASTLIWWLIGIIAAVLAASTGFAISVETAAARSATQLENHTRSIESHELSIKMLNENQQRDRDAYLEELKTLPTKMSKILRTTTSHPSSIGDFVDASKSLPLTVSEQQQLLNLLERARLRENSETKEVP